MSAQMLATFLVAAGGTALVCHIAWWRPELPDSVGRLLDDLLMYREVHAMSAVLEGSGMAPARSQIDEAQRLLAASLEAALAEVDLSPLELPYPKVMEQARDGLEMGLAIDAEGFRRAVDKVTVSAADIDAAMRAVREGEVVKARRRKEAAATLMPIAGAVHLVSEPKPRIYHFAAGPEGLPVCGATTTGSPAGEVVRTTSHAENVTCSGCLAWLKAKLEAALEEEPPEPISSEWFKPDGPFEVRVVPPRG